MKIHIPKVKYWKHDCLKDQIHIKILKDIDAPVELHIVNDQGFNWYKNFTEDMEEVLS